MVSGEKCDRLRTTPKFHQGLIKAGDRVLAGVSGGPDSMCLLHILQGMAREQGFSLVACHLNHGLREEAAAEARLVRDVSLKLGVPCITGRADVLQVKKTTGLSGQEAARELRYRFFRRAAGKCGANVLALGHHRDDQAETVLMNMLHGTGLDGLAGIPAKRLWKGLAIVRPLLSCSRRDIEEFCDYNGIETVQDKSNLQPVYRRNRLRLELMPLLETDYNPEIKKALSRQSALVRADRDYLERKARCYLALCGDDGAKGRLVIPRDLLRRLHPALSRRLLRLAVKRVAGLRQWPAFHHIEALRSMACAGVAGKKLTLPRGAEALMEDEQLIIAPAGDFAPGASFTPLELRVPGETEVLTGVFWTAEIRENTPETGTGISLSNKGNGVGGFPDGKYEACFDYHSLRLPLKVRTRRPGDRISPLGMAGKSKKLKKYYNDQKIPAAERDRVLIVVSNDDEIIWVTGCGIAHGPRVRPETDKILWLKIAQPQ